MSTAEQFDPEQPCAAISKLALMSGVLLLDRARGELDALATDLLRGQSADQPGNIQLGRAASYCRAAVQALDAAMREGLDAVGCRVVVYPQTAGRYLAQCREAAGLTTADVADRVSCEPRLSQIDRRAWIEAIEQDVFSPTIHEITALRQVYPFHVDVLARLASAAPVKVPSA